jgi:hypothetical protein
MTFLANNMPVASCALCVISIAAFLKKGTSSRSANVIFLVIIGIYELLLLFLSYSITPQVLIETRRVQLTFWYVCVVSPQFFAILPLYIAAGIQVYKNKPLGLVYILPIALFMLIGSFFTNAAIIKH